MATADYLPPVVTRLSMDLGDFAAKVAEAKAMMDSLAKGIEIPVTVDSDPLRLLNTRLLLTKQRADDASTALAAFASFTAGSALGAGSGGNGNGGRGGGLWWWGLNANTLHWIIAGGAEILAVTVPAMVALGAATAVAAQGYMNVQQHMQAVYTATEATANIFHVTAGEAVGMGHALQSAQDAANPAVYGVLGSAIITVKEHFGNLASTGLQVVDIFQTFAAKVADDFSSAGSMGATVDGLLAHMVPDLVQLGQVFGNLGHAVLSFASQMPGLAEILLKILADGTGFLSWLGQVTLRLQGLGIPILTAVMAFEEFNRWGGLVVNTLSRIGLASGNVTGTAFSLDRFGQVTRGLLNVFPILLAYVGQFLSRFGSGELGGAISGFAGRLEQSIGAITGWEAVIGVAAAAGLGYLIYRLITARDAVQQFTDALQQNVEKASNVNALQVIIGNVEKLNQTLASTPAMVEEVGARMEALNGPTMRANPAIAELNAGLRQQYQDMVNVSQGAAYLADTYHTSLYGAEVLADMANVKLANGITGTGQAAVVARMQIASLVQGYMSMGQPVGAVGSDMTALAIQSGLASTQVSKLNSAWDDFMTNLTGGTGGLSAFETSLANMTQVAATTRNNLSNYTGTMSLSVGQFADSLKTFSGTGAAAWQNFTQVVGSTAPQLIDWLRTAGAEGALSAGQFSRAVLGMVSQLTGFAQASPTAQAELLGLVHQVDPNITTWGQLTQTIKNGKIGLNDVTSAIQQATAKMGDMAAVAQQLGTVMQSALLSTLSQAKIAASGASGAMLTYEQMVRNGTATTAAGQGTRQQLIKDLEFLGYNAQDAAKMINMVAGALNSLHDKTVTLTVVTNNESFGGGAGGYGSSVSPVRAHAAGTPSAPSGWAWVGEAGPELVRFRGGETVLNNKDSMNAAGGGGGLPEIHNHFHVDGREIYSTVQKRAVAAQRRTGHNGLQKRTR